MLSTKNLSKSMGLVFSAVLLAGCPDAADEPAARPADPGAPVTAPATPPAATPGVTGTIPPGATAEMVAQGQQVYAGPGICFTCHGQNGQGTPLGPNIADGQWIWLEDGPDMMTQMVTVIRTGVSQPREYPAPMPPMGGANLSEDQLQAVSAYVLSLN
jgi:mono/diheme cytochrome c family protein